MTPRADMLYTNADCCLINNYLMLRNRDVWIQLLVLSLTGRLVSEDAFAFALSGSLDEFAEQTPAAAAEALIRRFPAAR